MNEQLAEMLKQGQTNLRQLLAGKHLRPAELALTMIVVAADMQKATEILFDTGGQARWENVNGEAP